MIEDDRFLHNFTFFLRLQGLPRRKWRILQLRITKCIQLPSKTFSFSCPDSKPGRNQVRKDIREDNKRKGNILALKHQVIIYFFFHVTFGKWEEFLNLVQYKKQKQDGVNDKQRFLFIPQEYLALLNYCPLFLFFRFPPPGGEEEKNRRIKEEEVKDDKKETDKREFSKKKKIEQKWGGRSLTHQHYFVMRSILQNKTTLILCNFP